MPDGMFSKPVCQNDEIKLLLADDSASVRRGIRQLLAAYPRIQVIGEAASFAQTIEMAKGLDPGVVVMDLHMSDERRVTPEEVRANLNQKSRLLAMSLWTDPEAAALAMSFGALILLDKIQLASTLVPAIMQAGK